MHKKPRSVTSRNVLILPYFDQWQWTFAIEFALKMRARGESVSIMKLEILGRHNVKRILKRIIGYSQVTRSLIRTLESEGVEIIQDWRRPQLGGYKAKFDAEGNFSEEDLFQFIAFPHIVNDVMSTDLSDPQYGKAISRRVKEVKLTYQTLGRYQYSSDSDIYTVNGRFCKNKAIKSYFGINSNNSVQILESASPGKYEILEDAQSVMEWQSKIAKHWMDSLDPYKHASAEEFFEEKAKAIAARKDFWTSQMSEGSLPELDWDKKICTFYSTTEIEFVGGGGNRPEGEIASQIEAIKALRTKLPLSEWELVVRRHPTLPGAGKSMDETLSRHLNAIEGIVEVSGESPVDSYALALKSDLVTHYGSTIGADLVYQGKKPVYALGRTPWQEFDPSHHLLTHESLEELDLLNLTISDQTSVYPWGYYQRSGGIDFEFLKHDNQLGWHLDGIPINIPFKKWIPFRLKTIWCGLRKRKPSFTREFS
jgi:hypothetical protein